MVDLIGTNVGESIVGNEAVDSILGLGGNDGISGFGGNDFLFGNEGLDSIDGGGGDDIIYGGKDDDFIIGYIGEDLLRGDRGNDVIFGGEGNDIAFGGKDNDSMDGGLGNDSISGDLGNDTLIGGQGIDTLAGGSDADVFQLAIGEGVDIITDFQDGIDSIQLPDSLGFNDLEIRQIDSRTAITIASNGEELALLDNISASLITEDDFFNSILRQRAIDTLSQVPVFTVADEVNSPLVTTVDDSSVGGIFISKSDADAFVDRLRVENPDLATSVQVIPISLSEVYEIRNSNNLQFAFIPESQEVDLATSLLQQQGQDIQEFEGVPLFTARDPNEGYLTISQNEEQTIPFSFRLEDLQEILDRAQSQQPDLVSSIEIEVLNLEGVINALETDNDPLNNLFLDRITLIPPEESLEFVEELQ